jgi:hypothetical protein
VEVVGLPVIFLLQVCILSDGGTRWSFVVVRLLILHSRIGGSMLCTAP